MVNVLAWSASWLLLCLIRLWMVERRLNEKTDVSPDTGGESVTVLQPILSGDPTLESNLRANLNNHPRATFIWLIDETDREGQRIATTILEHEKNPSRVRVALTPPTPQGANPKVFKLQIGLEMCGEIFAVLDDDTVLLPQSLDRAKTALEQGDLVTGLPYYVNTRTLGSRLVTAFVNANSLATYIPPLYFQKPVTINGMFYVSKKSTLLAMGGFDAIASGLCDDFELARLYRKNNRSIVQTAIVHPISTTVPDARSYARIMRRWMIFANRLFKESISIPLVVWVIVPSLLAPMLVLAGAVSDGFTGASIALSALFIKAASTSFVRRKHLGTHETLGTIGLEMVSDLSQWIHATAALVSPNTLQWRNKSIELRAEGIHYS